MSFQYTKSRQIQHGSFLTGRRRKCNGREKNSHVEETLESFQMANTKVEVSKCLRWLQAGLLLYPMRGCVLLGGNISVSKAEHRQLVIFLPSRLYLLGLLFSQLGGKWKLLMDALTGCQSSWVLLCATWTLLLDHFRQQLPALALEHLKSCGLWKLGRMADSWTIVNFHKSKQLVKVTFPRTGSRSSISKAFWEGI